MPNINSWLVSNQAIWAESVGGETIALRHPTYPAEAELPDKKPETLKAIVAKYLGKVHDVLGIPALFRPPPNQTKFKVHLAWLLLPTTAETLNPRESSRLTRFADPDHQAKPIDHTVVFCASEARDPDNTETMLGSRLGIRVTGHLRRKGRAWHLGITSVARSIDLPQALASRVIVSTNMTDFYTFMFDPAHLNILRISMRRLAGLGDATPVAIEGMRAKRQPDDTVLAEIFATASQPDDKPRSFGYALTMRFMFDSNTVSSPTVDKFPLLANAAPPVRARIFKQDPASRTGLGGLIEGRPNRSSKRLANFTDPVTLDGVAPGGGGMVALADSQYLASVMQSRLVNQTANPSQAEIVDPTVTAPRTNPFAALNAYGHVRGHSDDDHLRSLFNTILAFGIWPLHYFRFAAHPLQVRYRAPIVPGPGKDGKTVNAEVKFDPSTCDLIGPTSSWAPASLRYLELRFALADLKRTAGRRDALGLAADLRWSWHEYCHVLLAGRTGRLELHFAHSAGDALAAIVADPWSELANYPSTRGYTFPWVYLHRRHDRSVYNGWSWSGRYHRPNRFGVDSNCRHKGYQSEQILSTSLFRLYRALGGDTVLLDGTPDRPARQRAADYTVYLILRAIRLMPPHHLSVVETPDQLVTALIDADVGTLAATSGPLANRLGGWAHKVVRWAFEAQGLYATTNPSDTIDAPGLPPPVDIFIDTGRPPSEGGYPRGGYEPVSLDWRGATRRDWQAE